MKIKPGFMLREIDDTSVVVAVGEASEHFNGLITLNATGSFLWKQLQQGATEQELVQALCGAFEVDPDTARADTAEFVAAARKAGFLDE